MLRDGSRHHGCSVILAMAAFDVKYVVWYWYCSFRWWLAHSNINDLVGWMNIIDVIARSSVFVSTYARIQERKYATRYIIKLVTNSHLLAD